MKLRIWQRTPRSDGAPAGALAPRGVRLVALLAALAMIAAACGEEASDDEPAAPDEEESADPDEPEEDESDDDEAAAEEPADPSSYDSCDADVFDVRIGGGSPGSSVQVASTGISELISTYVESARSTVVSSGGAGANPELIQAGEVEMGTSVTTVLYELNQEDDVNWQMMMPGYTVPLYIATTQDSGIETWRDLEGRRLAMGPRGSGVSQTWTAMFEELGFEADLQYIPYDEGNVALRDGSVDAHMLGVNNFPAALEAEAFLGDDIKWIGFTGDDDISTVLDALPALQEQTLQADVYESLDENIDTVGYIASLIVREDVPDCVTYDVTRAFFEQGEDALSGFFWDESFELGLGSGFDTYEAMGVTVHNGYAQYWEEQGEEVPAALLR